MRATPAIPFGPVSRDASSAKKPVESSKIGDLDHARDQRRRADWSLPMSERLARVHELSRQMSAVKGAARER